MTRYERSRAQSCSIAPYVCRYRALWSHLARNSFIGIDQHTAQCVAIAPYELWMTQTPPKCLPRCRRGEQRIWPQDLYARTLRRKHSNDVHWLRAGIDESMGNVRRHFRNVGSLNGETAIADDVCGRAFEQHMCLFDVMRMKARAAVRMRLSSVGQKSDSAFCRMKSATSRALPCCWRWMVGEAHWYLSPFVGLARGSMHYSFAPIILSTQALILAQPSLFICSVQRAMIAEADFG